MKLFESYNDDLTVSKKVILGLQHTFTMFGATILVPILTGLNISVALFMAGLCTLLFHLVTRGKMPIFLGSSFAFIAPVVAVGTMYGLEYAGGGIVISGIIYLIMAGLIKLFGKTKILSFFPPIVTGPITIIIGLTLAPVAISSASSNWALAIASFLIVVIISVFTKGFLQAIPVLCGLLGGYLIAVVTGNIDYSAIGAASWVGLPSFTLAKFSVNATLLIAPVAIVTIIEHIGDVIAVGNTCKKDFVKDPGLNRTMLGDGLASLVSAMFGGPANTTYSENTGVLALTKVFNPVVMRIAALFAIVLALVPKFSAIISSIPAAVIGGISIVLFGMIASVGARILVESHTDFNQPRNLLIAASILVLGLGGATIPINIGAVSFTLSSLAVAAIAGIILNKVLPNKG
ncbi:MAG: uracil-xanthine permease family protein [Spirochaetaceae bacterium]|nr:uracil-xanthine permease family protein [Spirochaetaceae bacterium]